MKSQSNGFQVRFERHTYKLNVYTIVHLTDTTFFRTVETFHARNGEVYLVSWRQYLCHHLMLAWQKTRFVHFNIIVIMVSTAFASLDRKYFKHDDTLGYFFHKHARQLLVASTIRKCTWQFFHSHKQNEKLGLLCMLKAIYPSTLAPYSVFCFLCMILAPIINELLICAYRYHFSIGTKYTQSGEVQ